MVASAPPYMAGFFLLALEFRKNPDGLMQYEDRSLYCKVPRARLTFLLPYEKHNSFDDGFSGPWRVRNGDSEVGFLCSIEAAFVHRHGRLQTLDDE